MSKNLFTEEEVTLLRASPHVESVTVRSITFTPEFKSILYQELSEGGNIWDLLEKHGISTGVLGKNRVNGLLDKIRRTANREEGFQNLRRSPRKGEPQDSEESLRKQVKQLTLQLAYTRQEVEFLKKLQTADMEARKSWESKHRPR